MPVLAPSVVWTALPAGFGWRSAAAVSQVLLLGGGGQSVAPGGPASPPTVLAFEVAEPPVLQGPWKLPTELPANPHVEPIPFDELGPAMVSAAMVDGAPVATVMVQLSWDFGGCMGGWLHPVGSHEWDFIGSASEESDIGANDPVGIAPDALVTQEDEGDRLFVVTRHPQLAEVAWPQGMVTRTHWRPQHIDLPEGLTMAGGASLSPNGRWVGVVASDEQRMRHAVLLYALRGDVLTLVERFAYSGYHVEGLALTDDWIAIVEKVHGDRRLRWREVVVGADRYLEVGDLEATLSVDGSRALLTQGHRALVVDLARGVLTHNIQRGGVAQLGWGMLVPGFAVFALPDKVGAVAL